MLEQSRIKRRKILTKLLSSLAIRPVIWVVSFKMNDQLQKEFQYFLDHLPTLLEQYRGKFLVIRHQNVEGAYDSEEQAIREAMKEFKLGTFLVQECSDAEKAYTRTFRSRVAFA